MHWRLFCLQLYFTKILLGKLPTHPSSLRTKRMLLNFGTNSTQLNVVVIMDAGAKLSPHHVLCDVRVLSMGFATITAEQVLSSLCWFGWGRFDWCLTVEELSNCRMGNGAAQREGSVSLLEDRTREGRAEVLLCRHYAKHSPARHTASQQLLRFHFYLCISTRLSFWSLQPDISS